MRPAAHREPGDDGGDELRLIRCIGPHQIHGIVDSDEVTVTYPVGSDTVLSAQPDGTWQLVPFGTQGPYERALVKPDRLVFAPLGAEGAAFLVPYTDAIPNV
jgi:hypothetical protein